jgi:hypothetical protein
MYATGTISGGGLTAASTIYTNLADLMTTHPGWDFVETLGSQYIWKCLGSQNLASTDFYVGFSVNDPWLYIYAGETYDISTHTIGKFVAWDQNAPQNPDGTRNYTQPMNTLVMNNALGVSAWQGSWGSGITWPVNWNVMVTKSRLYLSSWYTTAAGSNAWSMTGTIVGLATARAGYPMCLFVARNHNPYEVNAYGGSGGYSVASRGIQYVQYSDKIAFLPATPAKEGLVRIGSVIPDPVTGATVGVPCIIVGPDGFAQSNIPTASGMGWRANLDDVVLFNEPYTNTIADIRPPGDVAQLGGVNYVKFAGQSAFGMGFWVKQDSDI